MDKLRTQTAIVAEIKRRFADETALNKDPETGFCYYAPRFNGCGCGIGCLFSVDDAQSLDNGPALISILVSDPRYADERAIVRRRIDLRVGDTFLWRVQCAHDWARNVADFLNRLDELA